MCRLVSSAFLHDSFSHLALNTYALYTVAPEVEAVLGHWTFLSVYLLAGLAGSSAAFVFGDTITVGASTCVFGLIGQPLVHVLASEPSSMWKDFCIFPVFLGLWTEVSGCFSLVYNQVRVACKCIV